MVAGLADRVCVLYAGRVVERGSVRDIYHRSRHPYTRGLLASVPRITANGRERLTSIAGSAPSLLALPAGCAFRPRCPSATTECVDVDPALRPVGSVDVACHHAGDGALRTAADRS